VGGDDIAFASLTAVFVSSERKKKEKINTTEEGEGVEKTLHDRKQKNTRRVRKACFHRRDSVGLCHYHCHHH
jgi:hypothetical protein